MKLGVITSMLGAGLLAQGAMAEAYLLKMKWEPGMVYKMQQSQVSDVAMPGPLAAMGAKNTTFVDTINTAVKHEQGVAVTTEFPKMKIDMVMGGKPMMAFDSSKEDQEGMLKSALKPILDAKLVSIYSPEGKFLSMEGGENIKGGADIGFDKKTLEQMVKQSTVLVPQREVEIGEKWSAKMEMPLGKLGGDLKMNFDLKLDSVTEKEGKKLAKVDFTGGVDGEIGEEGQKMKLKAKDISGHYFFDLGLGQISTTEMNMEFSISVAQAGGMEMNIKSKTKQTLVSAEMKK